MKKQSPRIFALFRIIRRRYEEKLVNKLVLFIAAVLFLVIGSLTYISYTIIQKESVNRSVLAGSNNLLLVNRNFQDYFRAADRYSLPQSLYDRLMDAFRSESSDYSSRVYLEDYVGTLFYARDDIDSVGLYIISSNVKYEINRSDYSGVRIVYDISASRMPWYRNVTPSTGTASEPLFRSGIKNSVGGRNFMADYRLLIPIGKTNPIAALEIHFNMQEAEKISKEVPLAQGEHLFFTDSSNRLYYTDAEGFSVYQSLSSSPAYQTIRKASAAGRFDWSSGGRKYLVLYDVSDDIGSKLIRLIPYGNIYASARETTGWCLAAGIMLLMLSILLVHIVTRAITRPLEQLSAHMQEFGGGNLDVEKLDVSGSNEISRLERQFNRMVSKINGLINERYKMKLIEKNAVLKALEAQINPHFLYNALQAISTMALKDGAPEVSDMVCALAMTFRYCISGAETVTVAAELDHIGNYLKLQKARFGERLRIQRDVDERALDAEIPKLSVQTLIENSIKHAMEKSSGGITVSVRILRDGDTVNISVSDNGPGIPPGRLHELERILSADAMEGTEDRSGKSIGLRNLSSRLELIFGEGAKLHIGNSSCGAEFYFSVPAKINGDKGEPGNA